MLLSSLGALLAASSLWPWSRPRHSSPPSPPPEHLGCVARSQSQYAEELTLLPTLLQLSGGARGVFVEMGAYDGIRFSNTLLLERCYGWTGLLIEANPSNYRKLVKSRRRAAFVHAAACADEPLGGPRRQDELRLRPRRRGPKHGVVGNTVNMTVDGGTVAGQVGAMHPSHVSYWADAGRIAPNRTVAVPCRPLKRIMAEAGLDGADFLSLDVEGAEDEVLATVDPAAFALILVETDGRDPAKEARVHARMMRAGLRLFRPTPPIWQSRVYIRPRRGRG